MIWNEDETMEERQARAAWDIACARLSVAEQLGWGLAMAGAGMLSLALHSYFAMISSLPIYWIATRQYVVAKRAAEERIRDLSQKPNNACTTT